MKKGIYFWIFGMILLFSLCCFGCIGFRVISGKFNENKQELFCKQIQPEMRREEVFAILSKVGEFETKKHENAYTISFTDPLKFLYYGGQTIIYFENDVYKGKVTYGSDSDFEPLCTNGKIGPYFTGCKGLQRPIHLEIPLLARFHRALAF